MRIKQRRSGAPDLTGLSQQNRDTFAIRIQCRKPNGGRSCLKRTLHGVTLGQAIEARDAMRVALRTGRPIPSWIDDLGGVSSQPSPVEPPSPSTTTTTDLPALSDFVAKWLKRKKARGDLEASTAERYATALDHLSPRLLRAKLDEITPEMIERWMLASLEDFQPSTVNGWLRVLRAALSRSGLVTNPASQVEPLKERLNLEEPNALRPRELRALLQALAGVDRTLAAAAWTLAFTGLRWGEVSALKWSDVDDREGVIWIRRKVVKGKLVPSTKTGRRRVVGAPAFLLAMLRSHQERLVAAKHPGVASELVFPSLKGTPLASARMSAALRDAREAAGITERFTSHGFRRSATDLLRAVAVDPAIAAAVIGHGTDRMRQHYSTIRPEEARDAAEAIATVLVGQLPEANREA
jgi:integrase